MNSITDGWTDIGMQLYKIKIIFIPVKFVKKKFCKVDIKPAGEGRVGKNLLRNAEDEEI